MEIPGAFRGSGCGPTGISGAPCLLHVRVRDPPGEVTVEGLPALWWWPHCDGHSGWSVGGQLPVWAVGALDLHAKGWTVRPPGEEEDLTCGSPSRCTGMRASSSAALSGGLFSVRRRGPLPCSLLACRRDRAATREDFFESSVCSCRVLKPDFQAPLLNTWRDLGVCWCGSVTFGAGGCRGQSPFQRNRFPLQNRCVCRTVLHKQDAGPASISSRLREPVI